ncbi:50S ribosomal protein L35ae [Candidatus Woesearchaeota archaeon]|nr:50S ribosomal protein L35ae [Candidatus Woesearchaeota archaeon]
MEGVIVNFRTARHHQKDNQMVIVTKDISKEKAKVLIGKTVVWTSPAGKEIKGKVSALHGSKGALRVLFEKGMPGQSVGSKVRIE